MSSAISIQSQSTTLAALRSGERQHRAEESDSLAPQVMASDTHQVNSDTTVTTLVLSSTGPGLPNLRLEDVLESSGVEDNTQVTLLTTSTDGVSENENAQGGIDGLPQSAEEQMQEAIDSIESSGAIIVEVETTNNIQTVKVRAADIDTVYTQASTPTAETLNLGTSNILLLKNGWAYTDMQTSPLELNLGPAEQVSGNGWTLWRKMEDGGHEIQDPATGAWNRVEGLLVDTSPKSATDVMGVFSTSKIASGILSTTTSFGTLKLSEAGVFTNSKTVLTTSGPLLNDISFISHTITAPGGTSSSFSGAAGSGGATIGSSTGESTIAGDMFGVFRMLEDGMTLELQFEDGSVERRLFLVTDQGSLTVDGTVYVRTDDVSGDIVGDLMSLLTDFSGANDRGKWLKEFADALRKMDKESSLDRVGQSQ